LTLTPASPNRKRDDELAKLLFDNVESIICCKSYTCENDQTLDIDDDPESIDGEIPSDDSDDDTSDDLRD
jgi:hypothetical protein